MMRQVRNGGARRGAGLAACVAACALGAIPAGCNRKSNVTVIQDNSPARLMEARQLAAQAQAESRAGRSDRAIELYLQSLQKSQDLGFVWNNLGLLYMEKDNYLDAVQMFQSAADVMPRSPQPYYNIGLAYLRRGWPKDALRFFDLALERDPRHMDSLRGAVRAAKLEDLADEDSLSRVRRALMVESDPRWKRMHEIEQIRIEGAIARAKEQAPLAMPRGVPVAGEIAPVDIEPAPLDPSRP